MKKRDYDELVQDFFDPYSAWIREKEQGDGNSAAEGFKDKYIGRYHILADPDGIVSPLLPECLKEANIENESYDFIYFDEDRLEGKRVDHWFKPDWSPDLLDSYYYPGGLSIVSDSLWEKVLSTAAEREGSYEFLRLCALAAEKRLHIARVMYHAFSPHDYSYETDVLKYPESESPGGESAYEGKNGSCATSSGYEGVISPVILSKDHPELLEKCLHSLCSAAELENCRLDIVVVDNGSSLENKEKYQALASEYNASYVYRPMDFIYSRLCNIGADEAKGRWLLFLNDDVEVPENTRFLETLRFWAKKAHAGAVGCKLHYPEGDKIQHCGISLLSTGPSHKLSGYADDRDYYHGVNTTVINAFAVTGACLMLDREKFLKVGGFDEELHVAYTDVDLCACLLEAGFYNICVNSLFLIHHESLSRDDDIRDNKAYQRLLKERNYFSDKHRELLKKGDPWYSPNLTKVGLDYRPDWLYPEERLLVSADKRSCGISGLKILREGDRKAQFSIDSIKYILSDAYGNEDYIEIRGWAFIQGEAGWRYTTELILNSAGDYFCLRTAPCMREDLPEVFPKERDILLSGFVARVSAQAFSGRDMKIMLKLSRAGFFNRKSERGYLIDTGRKI